MRTPVLPIVDLLILLASVSLVVAFVAKIVAVGFGIRLGLEPLDLIEGSGLLLLFALTLIGRDWLKSRDPSVTSGRRASESLRAYEALRAQEPQGEREAS